MELSKKLAMTEVSKTDFVGTDMFKLFGIAAFLVTLIALERNSVLRKRVENPNTHLIKNLAVGAFSLVALLLVERPVAQGIARRVERRKLGLLHWLRIPTPLHPVAGIIAMDYSLYVWHVLLHKVPFLWRFHLAHHTDRDLDASTAFRFHLGELIPSVVWRALQIRFFGITPSVLASWQTFLFGCIVFHHSNLRLPIHVERVLNRLLVTPRMHGIHHSIVPEEQNSNWSSGLTIWDRAHGTLKLNIPQDEIIVGVPAYLDADKTTLSATLSTPFQKVPDEWRLPNNGTPIGHSVADEPDTVLIG